MFIEQQNHSYQNFGITVYKSMLYFQFVWDFQHYFLYLFFLCSFFQQAQPIPPELTAKLLGNRVAVSPIVTVEPRRRKFHKPITLTIPVPQAAGKGMINQYNGETPTLRLLCSITGIVNHSRVCVLDLPYIRGNVTEFVYNLVLIAYSGKIFNSKLATFTYFHKIHYKMY